MTPSWLFQFYRIIRAPETARGIRNAIIGILLIPLIELAVTPLQMAFDSKRIDLPASILVMVSVTIAMVLLNSVYGGVTSFYDNHMKGPINFLGQHMSFGFVASIVMLSKDHITTAADTPRIVGAFAVTTLFSYIGSYLFAMGSYTIEERLRRRRKRADDSENIGINFQCSSYHDTRVSQASRLSAVVTNSGSLSSLETLCALSATPEFMIQTVPLWFSLFLLITVGLPISFAMAYDTPFETFCFVFFWVGSIQFQRYIKTCKFLKLCSRIRSVLTAISNPVLITSSLGTAYFWTKAAITHQSIDTILGEFKRHKSWAEIMVQLGKDGNFCKQTGAGDLANALLDAGIVSLGFKMFEYRYEVWKSFMTIFSTSLAFATINIFLNVIVARAMGLQAAEALAFGARNVTIALGVPAIQHLNGSTTLMSTLCVVSGMLFQMTGDILFSWLHINDRALATKVSTSIIKTEKKIAENERQTRRVIAAGVTVGINAAAMGTSHLIERKSTCTAFSALSMTVFGALTVAFTAIPPIADIIKQLASR